MNSDSPMMRRVRADFLKTRIPRKGRIRFLLAIIILVAAIHTVINLKKQENKGQGKETPGSELTEKKAEKKAKKSAAEKVKRKAVKKTVKRQKPAEQKKKDQPGLVSPLTFGDLTDLIKKNPPDLFKDKDSIKYRGKDLTVHYSINTQLQELGQSLLKRYHPLYGAIAAVHPSTGRVLVLLSYKNDSVPDLGVLYCKSLFPAASIFKTITAAAAIEKANLLPESLLPHAGRNHTLYRFQLEKELKNYIEISLEDAYALSINPVFARIGLYSLSKGSLLDYGNRFGFNCPIPFEIETEISRVISPDSAFALAELASGFNQQTTISPVHGAMIAAAISENGRMQKPVLIDSICMDDTCIYKAAKETWRTPIKESTSKELKKMMSRVSRYGTARKSFRYIHQSRRFSEIEYGGKTGSVDKDGIGRVDWFIGFARNPLEKKQQIAVSVVTVHGSNWTVHSAYIAAEIMRIYIRSLDPKP